jgi:hypothetical protein
MAIPDAVHARRRWPGWRWLVAPAVLALMACTSRGQPPSCPDAGTLADAARVVAFRDDGRDLTDKRFEARITDVAVACDVNRDEDGQTVRAEMKVRFDAEKGPANADDAAAVRYFVAITDAQQRVLKRRAFDVRIPLPGNTTRNQTVETLSPTLPLKPDVDPGAYRFLVGFELSRAQLRYNRDNPL